MIERPEYLKQLIAFKDKDLIKIVTGIRRCGKSTLFDLYSKYLQSNGVDKNQIVRINLEDYEFNEIENYSFDEEFQKIDYKNHKNILINLKELCIY